jgi:transposase
MAMAIVDSSRLVVGGVDTHLDEHVAAVVDAVGGVLGVGRFPVTTAGYRQLLAWMRAHGRLARVGVEGTGAYGAGLTRHLMRSGLVVMEVTRPNRQERHRNGKDDDLDAIEAARAVIAGRALATAKTSTGGSEALRVLVGAQRSAKQARISAMVQLRHLMFTAPDELRERYAKLPRKELTAQCARLRPRLNGDSVGFATKTAALTLARRVQAMDAEIRELDALIAALVKQIAPDLLNIYGVGTNVAATILVAVGDNPERIPNEAAFAKLCGVAPLPANSGKRTNRHKLHPGGNRHANSALWHIVLTRTSQKEPRTAAYLERRRKQGLTNREIFRCLTASCPKNDQSSRHHTQPPAA